MELKPSVKTVETKTTSKRKNNAGTFNIDNPKKTKKYAKQSLMTDKIVKNGQKFSDESEVSGTSISPARKKRLAAEDQGEEDFKVKRAKLSPKQDRSAKSFKKGSKDHKFKKNKMLLNKFSPNNLNKAQEKPNWNDFKKDKKALRDKRRAAEYEGDTYDVSVKAKKKLETIRSKNSDKDMQVKELINLHSMLKDKLLSVVYAHDMSRVIQTMLKLAHTHKQTRVLKNMIQELMHDIAGMSKKKYAVHVAKTVIELAPDDLRQDIFKAFQGSVMKLLAHSIGHTVIQLILSKLKPNERHLLQKELYGGSYKIVTSEPVTSLDVIFKVLPHMKEQTLNNTKENITTLFEKGAVDSPVVHAVLLDYLSHSKAEDISLMLDSAREHVKALINSKDGVHVLMMCVWMGTPKARKKIIKDLKGKIANLASGEHTHLLLLAIFDCVDDTKLIEKVIIPELIQEEGTVSQLLQNTYGRKVLAYLCSRRDPRLFSAPVVAVLSQGDNNPHSKKDAEVRASELLNIVAPKLLRHISENASQWIDNHSNLIVLLIVLKSAEGDELESALVAVAKHIVSPPGSAGKDVDLSRADNTACHSILKKLAEHDTALKEKGLVTFGAVLLGELSDRHIMSWLTNNHCCFLLLTVLQHGTVEVVDKLTKKIKKQSSKVWTSPDSIPLGGKKLEEMLMLNL